MPQADRRINKRVPAEFRVNYIHDGDYLISYSKDLSVDGMFIYTEHPTAVDDTSKLTFSIGELKDLSITAKVIWINKSKSPKDSGMGVQFIDPPKKLNEAILKIINRVALLEKE